MITTRQQFVDYCLRALGDPVVDINVDELQIDDRVDEAIEYWRLYHHEGIEKVYLKHQMLASKLTITTNNGGSFNVGDTLTGQTSGATVHVVSQTDGVMSSGNTIIVRKFKGTFEDGETISNGTTTAILADTNAVTYGEFDLQYIDLPDSVYGVTRMLPFAGTQTSKSMFDIQYQLRLNDLYDLTSTSIIYYKMVMGHLALLDLELNGKPMIDFNRMQGRLYPRINWDSDISAGDYIIVECYRALDPTTFTRVWNELWLKHYAVALIKRQWAINLKKFSGLQLPGGVSLDGQALYNEAIQEIKELEDEIVNKSAPLEFFIG